MAEQQLLRCREMAAELAHTQVGQAASIIIAVVNEVVADKRYQKPLVDFMVQNAHITLFRLLQAEKQALRSGYIRPVQLYIGKEVYFLYTENGDGLAVDIQTQFTDVAFIVHGTAYPNDSSGDCTMSSLARFDTPEAAEAFAKLHGIKNYGIKKGICKNIWIEHEECQ
jgi:hypothetical protein